MATDRSDGFGTGLSAWQLAVVLFASIAVFFYWNGALWNALPGASHIGRLLVSYLMVIPAVAIFLVVDRHWSWIRLASAVGLLWSVKLVVTSIAYAYLAPGSASVYSPKATWETPAAEEKRARADYRPASGDRAAELRDVSGVVRDHGIAVPGAIVFLDAPAPGHALGSPRAVPFVIDASHYGAALLLASVRDSLMVENRDGALHTLRFDLEGRTETNLPLPAGSKPRPVSIPRPGVYQVRCGNHANERSTVVVVDHPYAVETDAGGRFQLSGVADRAPKFVVLRPGLAQVHRTVDLTSVAKGSDVVLETSEVP